MSIKCRLVKWDHSVRYCLDASIDVAESQSVIRFHVFNYTPLAVVSRARKTLRVSTTATIAQITDVSSKEGAMIGAVLGTRTLHRGHH
jgi:hypothetical protein